MRRKFPSYIEAYEYLESVGEVKCWGRIGWGLDIILTTLKLPNGRTYSLNVHLDGLVEVREE